MKSVRELFLNDGVDEQVLADLKEVCRVCAGACVCMHVLCVCMRMSICVCASMSVYVAYFCVNVNWTI